MDLQLLNKIAIVTGASRGLGFASAQALVQEGCRVAICARGEAQLNEAAAELRAKASASDQVRPIQADASTTARGARLLATTVDSWGGVDILINNVGLARGTTIVDTTDAEWQESIE